ncbi:MAG: TIGR01459 family HAD-type hydrolase [Fimbriimonadaceae bacterium]|nr:TIGR01459 family HAD-type hydrolase [Alphaproteobacteria bacterium]
MTLSIELPPEISGLSVLAGQYDGLMCDIWGVVHNGVEAYPEAVTALETFRKQGGVVVLITNSPRTAAGVADQLEQLQVPAGAWDRIVTSGDITRELLSQRDGQAAYHLGPERDRGTFAGTPVQLVDEELAGFVVCTGLFDDEAEGPDDYRVRLQRMRGRDLTMICSNPDLVVQRGDRHIYCAGALAALYEELGGHVVYTGKPWAPIYEAGFKLMDETANKKISRARILAIGDAIRTDLLGAKRAGIASLFVLGGIHAAEIVEDKGRELAAKLAEAGVSPVARQSQLTW